MQTRTSPLSDRGCTRSVEPENWAIISFRPRFCKGYRLSFTRWGHRGNSESLVGCINNMPDETLKTRVPNAAAALALAASLWYTMTSTRLPQDAGNLKRFGDRPENITERI